MCSNTTTTSTQDTNHSSSKVSNHTQDDKCGSLNVSDLKSPRTFWIEPEESDKIDTGVMKALTGGDKFFCRPLYQE
jgi:hypothetical protein